MKTLLKDLLQADWGPTMRGIAWALGHAAMVPTAVAIVFVQWLGFAWRRPLAGVLALVPVRRPDPFDAIIKIIYEADNDCGLRAVECWTDRATGEARFRPAAPQPPNLTDSAPNLASSSPNLTTSDLNKAGASLSEAELDSMSLRMDFGMARPTPPPASKPPALAPGPRRQRRGSNRPQGTA